MYTITSFFRRLLGLRVMPYCPHVGRACIHRHCVHWLVFKLPPDRTQPHAVQEFAECSHNWTARLLYDAKFTQEGQQAAIESLRNQTNTANDIFGVIAAVAQHTAQATKNGQNGQKRLDH